MSDRQGEAREELRRPANKEALRERFRRAVLDSAENYKRFTTDGEPSIRKVGDSLDTPNRFYNVVGLAPGEPTWETVALLAAVLHDPDRQGWLRDAGFDDEGPLATAPLTVDEMEVVETWRDSKRLYGDDPETLREELLWLRRATLRRAPASSAAEDDAPHRPRRANGA